MNSTSEICCVAKLLSGAVRKKCTKADVIKRLMKEQKATFGALLETKQEKIRRLNLEKKGVIVPTNAKLSGNSELAWMLKSNGTRRRLVKLYPKHEISTFDQPIDSFVRLRPKSNKVFSKVQMRIIRKTCEPNVGKSKSKPAAIADNVLPETESNKKITVEMAESVDATKSLLIITKDNAKETESGLSEEQNDCILPPCVDIIKNISKRQRLFPVRSKTLDVGHGSEIISISPTARKEYFAFPSVTRILNATMSENAKKMLELWMARMIRQLGKEGFDAYKRGLLENGKLLHSAIDGTLRKLPVQVPDNLRSCYDSVKIVLDEVEDVRVIESQVVHENLGYRGVVDCVATYRGNLCLIDWKKSDKTKHLLSATYDAPLQIASYIGALNADKNYPFEITSGLLVIAYTLGDSPTVFTLNGTLLQHYWKQWLVRLKKYYIAQENT